MARGGGHSIFVEGASVAIANATSKVSIDFTGARKVMGIAGAVLPGTVNYIHGSDPRRWQIGRPTYSSVTYRQIYPSIDVIYLGNQGQLEFDLVLRPRADPSRIRLRFEGAKQLLLDTDGALLVHTSAEDLRIPLPVIYQDVAGARKPIAGRYEVLPDFEVAFRLDPYDRTRTLVIDPTVAYTYLLGGGTGPSAAEAVAADRQGNAYVAGLTGASDFPLVNSAYSQFDANGDGFISKIDPSGTTLLYSTYVGGMGVGTFTSIAVDSAGNAWLTGRSFELNFPVVNGYQGTPGNFGPYGDAVVMELSPAGVPLFSGYLGSGTTGNGIAVDANGNAYVACNTDGSSTQFPATAGAYLTSTASANGFIAKLTAGGVMVYAAYFYGTAAAIAVDSAGSAYITGNIGSVSNVPPGGAQPDYAGGGDAYVAKFNPSGSALEYFTFLGGSQSDAGNAIAVDGNGNAYVGGSTASPDFPVTAGALQTVFGGATDGFVAMLNSAGSSFPYVTYLGGSRVESVTGLAIDASGNAFVTGSTDSAQFPTASPIDGALSGNASSLYRTTDGGNNWAPLDGTIPGAVTSISPDPTTAGVLVAATEFGVFRSIDSGQSWTQTGFFTNSFLSRSPVNPSIIYQMAPKNLVERSTDGGTTWSLYGPILNMPEAEILANPTYADAAYAYTLEGTNVILDAFGYGYSTSTFNCQIDALVAGSDGSLYADLYGFPAPGASCGVEKGGSILSGAPAATTPALNSLAISASNPSILYKSSGAGPVYVTTDGGATWSPTGTPPAPLGTLAVSATNSSLVYAAASAGPVALYTSTDGGNTWNAVSGLGVAGIGQIIADPVNGSEAYALAPVTAVAFAAEINPSGTALTYSTYLGSTGLLSGNGIALGNGDAFVAGAGYVPFQPVTGIYGLRQAYEQKAAVVRISGATAACSFSVTPPSQMVYGSAATLTYDIVAPSGCSWTASADQQWATIAQGSTGSGSSVVVIGIPANNSSATRTANLTIGGRSVSLTQTPSSCTYSVNPSQTYVGAIGGMVQTTVTAGSGCPWAVVNNQPSAASVTQGATGSGSGTVTFQVAPTVLQTQRSLTFTIGNAGLVIVQTSSCAVTLDTRTSVADVQQMVNEALGLVPPSNDLDQDGTVNAVDAQIVINGVLGDGCIVK